MHYEKERRYIIPFQDVPSPRAEMPEISVEERRGNFQEVETGFPEETAVQEAGRCLSCRRCLGCALCWAECKPEAIDFSIPDEEVEREFDEVILTRGQDNQFEPLPSEFGFGRYPDVITDLQMERMLSPLGPTDGMVVSPLNGDIPVKIALVQADPKAEEDHLLRSSIFSVNAAALALQSSEGLETVLISPICESFRDQFLAEARKLPGLQVVEGAPVSVEREGEGKLKLVYAAEGRTKEDAFDLVVFVTKPKLSRELQSLSKDFDQKVL